MVERLSLFQIKNRPLRANLRQARVELTRAHLAEVTALQGGLADKIILLPFRGKLIGTEQMLSRGLRGLGFGSRVSVEDEGLDFGVLRPTRLTVLGDAAVLMRSALSRRGTAKVALTGRSGARAIFEVERSVADSRQVTARLAENEGKLAIVFSIYRNVVSLLDYVQVALVLPGLEVDRHPRRPDRFFLTAV